MSKKLKDLSRRKIYEIACEYATSPYYITASYFAEKYGFTERVFYNVLKTAVIESIVPESIVSSISKKAAYNAEIHAGIGGRKLSENNYKAYLQQRSCFEFSKSQKKKWAELYADSSLSPDSFIKASYLSFELFERTIYSAIVDNLVSDEIVEKLRQKEMRCNGVSYATSHFDDMIIKRKHNKELTKKSK